MNTTNKKDSGDGNSYSYQISSSRTTPEISFDHHTLKISGRSSPENASEFYKPIAEKVKEGISDSTFKVDLNLTYINTSSSRSLFSLLDNIGGKGNMQVVWNYEEDDEDMLELGEDFSDLLGIPFEFKESTREDN